MTATRAADDATLLRRRRAARRRAAARRRHHLRMQERLRADRRRRGPLAADRQGRHRRDHVPWRPRRSRRSSATTARPTSTWSPDRCSQACAPHARWVDVFCDRGAFDVDETRHILTAGMAAGSRRAAARRPARPQCGHPARGRAGRGVGGSLHLCHRRRRRGARRGGRHHRRHAAAGRRILDARTVSGRQDGSSTRARPSRWRPTAIPAVRSRPACRSASRSRCGT